MSSTRFLTTWAWEESWETERAAPCSGNGLAGNFDSLDGGKRLLSRAWRVDLLLPLPIVNCLCRKTERHGHNISAMDGPNSSTKPEGGVLNDAVDFAQSFGYSAFKAPVDAVRQLAGAKVDPAPENDTIFKTAGQIAGSVFDFVVLSKALKVAAQPLESTMLARTLPILEPTVAGGIMEASRPVDDAHGKDLLTAKRNQFLVGGVTFGVMGGVQRSLSDLSLFGRAGQRSLIDSILANSLAGGAGGGAGATADGFLNTGKAPTVDQLNNAIVSNAAFGGIFGVADYAFGVTKPTIRLKSEAEATTSSRPPDTAQWAKDGYDPNNHIRSPIFDYIAQNNPELRPPNYEAWKAQQASVPLRQMTELSLSDFSPEQRAGVVEKLRSLARSDLASDQNIDAFVGRLRSSNLDQLSANASDSMHADLQALKAWKAAHSQLSAMRDAVAPGRTLTELLNDKQFLQQHEQLNAQLQQTIEAERNYRTISDANKTQVAPIAGEMESVLGGIASDAHLPKPLLKMDEDSGGSYFGDRIGMSPYEMSPGVSTSTVETSMHEFRHHQDGSLNIRNIGRLLKLSLSSAFGNKDAAVTAHGRFQKAAAQIDNLSAWSKSMDKPGEGLDLARQIADHPQILDYISADHPSWQSSVYQSVIKNPGANSDELLRADFKKMMATKIERLTPLARIRYMNYVSEPSELRAYSTGILGRMRAQAWGVPEPAMESTSLSQPESLLAELSSK